MKKIFILLVLLFCLSQLASAQCTPDPAHTTELIYPNPTSTTIIYNKGTQRYDNFTLNIPKDTTVSVLGVNLSGDIVEIEVLNVLGVPPGLGFECNPSNCIFPGNSSGCVRVGGTPIQEGDFQVTIKMKAVISVLGTNTEYPIEDNFNMKVLGPNSLSDVNYASSSFFPNPVESTLNIDLEGRSAVVTLFNLMGVEVTKQKVFGIGKIDTSELSKGVYFIVIEGDSGTRKEVIRKI